MKTAALAIALLLSFPVAAQKDRVIFQVSDAQPAKWDLALNNARNVLQEYGRANIEIEIMAYGPGIEMMKMETPAGPRLAQALDIGIKLIACENTMTNAKLSKDDMYGGISFVRSGVTHIMKRQKEGWAYIRP